MGLDVRKARALGGVRLSQLLRDRVGLFFTLVLPFLIVFMLGLAFAGAERVAVGVVDDSAGPHSEALVAQLEATGDLTVRDYDDADGLRTAVRRGETAGGVLIPPDYDDVVVAGGTAEVALLVDTGSGDAAAVQALVYEAVAVESGRIVAARASQAAAGGTLEENLERAAAAAATTEGIGVEVTSTGGEGIAGGLSIRDFAVVGQLVMFLFLIALAGSADLAESRRLGVSRRMLATPTTSGTVILGEGLGRFGIAMVQALVIVLGTAVLFGVDWVAPALVALVVVVFSLVATAAGLLVGAVARSGEQAGALGPVVGIALGFLGGCTWPLELVPEPMQVAAHLTPHAWAMDALTSILGDGAGLREIAPDVAVLMLFAAVLLPVAARRLRTSLMRA